MGLPPACQLVGPARCPAEPGGGCQPLPSSESRYPSRAQPAQHTYGLAGDRANTGAGNNPLITGVLHSLAGHRQAYLLL